MRVYDGNLRTFACAIVSFLSLLKKIIVKSCDKIHRIALSLISVFLKSPFKNFRKWTGIDYCKFMGKIVFKRIELTLKLI